MNILKLFKNIFKLKNYSKDEGFTFFEFIIVISLLGITTSLFLPIFKNLKNKSKQKEATLIVSSIIKSAKSSYGIYSYLPNKMGDLSKFAKFQKCIEDNVEQEGGLVCKNTKAVKTEKEDTSYFSPTGNYKIEIKQESSTLKGEMFLVKANPNGSVFSKEGSAVIGCYSPTSGISLIKNYSSKKSERGIKEYIECGKQSKEPLPDPCLLNPNDPDCKEPRKPRLTDNPKQNSNTNDEENFDKSNNGFSESLTDNKQIKKDLETVNEVSEKESSINSVRSGSLTEEFSVFDKSENNNTFKELSIDDDDDDLSNPIPPWIR